MRSSNLLSYGPDRIEVSASHQSQALGLDVPVHLQQIADEVIE
ncbi:MAG: hypothetical protein WCD56_02990 [Pseudolabrys sp.]|jgi:hypothetical protein